ncbi:MAG: Asp-tRNA(Asn)/Glu-tRNA(Gln) amidotransferase subunit GatC [Candidatus Omnitrophota bacterium]|nr:Asp-tRNA(Asn)/Glu-tRNA(Gln) amidotransferase subunit GatC [Candidatus Omnitrophota bacterium]
MLGSIDINYVAKLARIRLADSEKEHLAKDLSNILNYIDKLNQLNTEQVPPTSHILGLQNVFREDEVLPSLKIDEVLDNAPMKDGTSFKVPRII